MQYVPVFLGLVLAFAVTTHSQNEASVTGWPTMQLQGNPLFRLSMQADPMHSVCKISVYAGAAIPAYIQFVLPRGCFLNYYTAFQVSTPALQMLAFSSISATHNDVVTVQANPISTYPPNTCTGDLMGTEVSQVPNVLGGAITPPFHNQANEEHEGNDYIPRCVEICCVGGDTQPFSPSDNIRQLGATGDVPVSVYEDSADGELTTDTYGYKTW